MPDHSLEDKLTNLLNDINGDNFDAVLGVYRSTSTTEDERDYMRREVAPITGKLTGSVLAKYWKNLRESKPYAFITASLAQMSLCDGWPDPRDASMSVSYLKEYADGHQIDLQPHVDQIKTISTPRMVALFEGHVNLSLWRHD